MRVALITSNMNGIDTIIDPVAQDMEHDFHCYTLNNLPVPLTNMNDRMKARYIKHQSHRFLPDYDFYIWMDGRAEILSSELVSTFIKLLIQGADMVMTRHHLRNNVYEELEFILRLLEKGNPYLVERYQDQPIREELEYYRAAGMPDDYPLYACGIFARGNNKRMNDLFDEWWKRCVEYGYYDQCWISYLSWKRNIRIHPFPYENDLIRINKHRK